MTTAKKAPMRRMQVYVPAILSAGDLYSRYTQIAFTITHPEYDLNEFLLGYFDIYLKLYYLFTSGADEIQTSDCALFATYHYTIARMPAKLHRTVKRRLQAALEVEQYCLDKDIRNQDSTPVYGIEYPWKN